MRRNEQWNPVGIANLILIRTVCNWIIIREQRIRRIGHKNVENEEDERLKLPKYREDPFNHLLGFYSGLKPHS